MTVTNLSDEDEDDFLPDFSRRLEILDTLVKLGWWLLAGAFALGLWVARIQFTVSQHSSADQTAQQRLRDLELNERTQNERTTNILRVVERIDRKLNP